MGWKVSTIIIHRPTVVDNERLLVQLGCRNLVKIEEEPFEIAIFPDNNKIYIGNYKNNLLICAPDFPFHFFKDNEVATERTLSQIFPTSEICSIVLHSAINLWAYSVIKDGKIIRKRAGSSENGTFFEIGEPLVEEKELLSKSKTDKKGNRVYFLDNFPEELFTEDQVGENFVFSVCKRYFGENFDNADDLLYNTNLIGYSYQRDTGMIAHKKLSKNISRPWWKFW